MSREGFEGFSRLLMENKEILAKVKSFGDSNDKVSAYAKEMGFDVSSEELREYQDMAIRILDSRIQKLKQSEATLSPGAKEFYKLIELSETDEDVANRMVELGSGTVNDLIAYGKEKGFTFTEQDIKAVSKDIMDSSDELSEEELEMVAGGVLFAFAAAVVVGVALGGAATVGAACVGAAAGAGVILLAVGAVF